MNHHKRGFTLTELLIVVIVIGILSAVVLPRYNKTLETRKTTEAEGILSAIRTEQERRCTLGKKYVTDMAGLSEIVPNATTDNYEYSLVPTSVVGEGISYRTVSARAISRGSYDYGLYMFSNSDGRICCAGPDCTKLNKDYPLCEELQQNTDLLKAASEEAYECGTRSVAPIPNPPAPRPWEERINGEFVLDKDPDDGGGSGGGDGGDTLGQELIQDISDKDACIGSATRRCGCESLGTQTRTCGADGWSAWGDCDMGSNARKEETCGCHNSGIRIRTCNLETNTWKYSSCSESNDCECEGTQTATAREVYREVGMTNQLADRCATWSTDITTDDVGVTCPCSYVRFVRYCNTETGHWRGTWQGYCTAYSHIPNCDTCIYSDEASIAACAANPPPVFPGMDIVCDLGNGNYGTQHYYCNSGADGTHGTGEWLLTPCTASGNVPPDANEGDTINPQNAPRSCVFNNHTYLYGEPIPDAGPMCCHESLPSTHAGGVCSYAGNGAIGSYQCSHLYPNGEWHNCN